MDVEHVKYILHYFPQLMTEDERLALSHQKFIYNYDEVISESSSSSPKVGKSGLINANQADQDVLAAQYAAFELQIATRILNETPEKVFFNYCPACNGLVRTPQARQCRHCGKSWRS